MSVQYLHGTTGVVYVCSVQYACVMARQWPIRSRVRHEKTSRYPNIIAFYESVQMIHTLYSAFIRMAKHSTVCM